jgi:glycosylphosphatidylinositol phospholipase D
VEQWDDDAKKLVAFLFGADSHQIADINWHGLGEAAPRWSTLPGTGFLNVLGALEYNCNGTLCSDAHTEGDIGGDFVVSTQMDLAWLKTLWYIPSNHLAEIYKRMNQTFKDPVTPDKIASSMAVILVGAHAEKTLASLIYPYYYSKSPFLASKMQDHYIGGIDDDGKSFGSF